MPTIINNEYFTKLDIDSINSINSFFAHSADGSLTLMVRNSKEEQQKSSYNNKNLFLKSNVKLEINSQTIGMFHILTCISGEIKIQKDFKRICNYIFVETNEARSSDEVTALFYSLQNVFSETNDKDTQSLQIGLFGEYIALLKLVETNNKAAVDKWHKNYSSRHDIEIDEFVRIEIKTTTKSKRIHRFNHDQISRDNLKIFVISNVIELSEMGTSLYKLSLTMMSLFSDYEKKLLIEQLINRCGISEHNQGITSNLDDCLNNCNLYEDRDIPKLSIHYNNSITNIAYDIDFSSVAEVDFFMDFPKTT